MGPVYCEEDLEDSICPWCIADGSAHGKFHATFVDEGVLPDDLSNDIIEELSCRTPGYSAWQTEQWITCCNDAMMFIEPVGILEIREHYRELEFSILSNIIYDLHISGSSANRILESLDRRSGPTAYVFQCRHCGTNKTFVDGIFDAERTQ